MQKLNDRQFIGVLILGLFSWFGLVYVFAGSSYGPHRVSDVTVQEDADAGCIGFYELVADITADTPDAEMCFLRSAGNVDMYTLTSGASAPAFEVRAYNTTAAGTVASYILADTNPNVLFLGEAGGPTVTLRNTFAGVGGRHTGAQTQEAASGTIAFGIENTSDSNNKSFDFYGGGYFDVKEYAAPGNPAAGDTRCYSKTSSGELCCRDSAGTETCMSAGSGGSAHNILSATHSDSLAGTVTRGDIIVGNSTPAWSELAIGGSGTVLQSDGTDVAWATKFTDIDTDYGDETVTSQWTFVPDGTGTFGTYDLTVGDGTTPDYGALQIGGNAIYTSSFSSGNLNLDKTMVFRNEQNVSGILEFAWIEQGNSLRAGIPESGAGNAANWIRSFMIAGPYSAATGDNHFICDTHTTYNSNIDCDTGTTGPDLFVLDDAEIEGTVFTHETIQMDADDANQLTISAANQTGSNTFTFPDDTIAAGDVLFGTGAGTFAYDPTPAIDCTDCTNIPAGTVADLNDITNVTLTTPADGAVLCFTGTSNNSVDCTPGGDVSATEDSGTLTVTVNDVTDATSNTESQDTDNTQVATTAFVHDRFQQECRTIESPTTADLNLPVFIPRLASTIEAVSCHGDAAATVRFEDFGGTAIETFTCDTTGSVTWDSAISGTATLSAGEVMRIDFTAASSPTWVVVCYAWSNT